MCVEGKVIVTAVMGKWLADNDSLMLFLAFVGLQASRTQMNRVDRLHIHYADPTQYSPYNGEYYGMSCTNSELLMNS